MALLWKNNVPMCIEVLLLPDCPHGQHRAESPDVSLPAPTHMAILLEQWTIQGLTRRSYESQGVPPSALFQAVKSYLYFSQLSAWYNLTHGTGPRNVAYRISPPGEFCTSQFHQVPQWHTFPVSTIPGKSASIKVTVGALPRREEIINVPCPEPHGAADAFEGTGARQKQQQQQQQQHQQQILGGYKDGMLPVPRQFSAQTLVAAQSPWAAKPRLTRPLPPSELCLYPQPQLRSPPRVRHRWEARTPQGDMYDSCRSTLGAVGGAIPKRKTFSESSVHGPGTVRRPASAYLTEPGTSTSTTTTTTSQGTPRCRDPNWSMMEHHSAPNLEVLYPSHGPRLQRDHREEHSTSPKVILTQKATGQGYYDFDNKPQSSWFANALIGGAATKDSTDSDNSSPEIDRFLQRTLGNSQTQLEPLSPQEMETYLASWCMPKARRRLYQQHSNSSSPAASPSPTLFKESREKEERRQLQPAPWELQTKLEKLNLSTSSSSNSPPLTTSSLCLSPPSLSSSSSSSSRSSKCSGDSSYSNGVVSSVASSTTPKTPPCSPNGHPVKFLIGEEETLSSTANSISSQQTAAAKSKSFQNGTSPSPSSSSASASSSNGAISESISSKVTSLRPHHPPPAHPLPVRPTAPGYSLHPQVSNKELITTPTKPPVNSLLKNVMRKELGQKDSVSNNVDIPSEGAKKKFHDAFTSSAKMIFHRRTGLPLQSSPAPIKKKTSLSFGYDCSLTSTRAIKSSISCVSLDEKCDQEKDTDPTDRKSSSRFYSTSAPASTNSLLGNFEESMLNGRLEPSGVVDGFQAEIGASGSFCPKHVTLPVTAFFFSLSDDNAPSPYLGHINLESVGKRGYHIPNKGTVQVTLFNPNKTVVKMFVVMYDLRDMPPQCQTFLRQRTLYMPVPGTQSDVPSSPVFLRYLIHLRFTSSRSGKIYLHTDLRLIFARDKVEYDSRVANYELRSFTEGPVNPKFSPKK